MVFLITSSLLGSINFIVTTVQLRAPGLSFWRLPFFVWAQFVTSFLLLLAFPPLEGAAVLQLMDRLAKTSFFLPSGLVVSGQVLAVSGGGNPLLWQHLFWFLAHPEVYVLILPAMGIVAEVVANNTRKPLWGYRSMVYSLIFLGFMSFIVWAHHMFITGMGTTMATFFQTTTMIISIPSVVILSSLLISLYGGSIRFTTPMLFALGFISMFLIGGLSGVYLASVPITIHASDTYFIVAHIHYVLFGGSVLTIFAGIYYWFPKMTGRMYNESLGKLHFWLTFVSFNLTFFPMHWVGLVGMPRRVADYSDRFADLNLIVSISSFALGASVVVFFYNIIVSWARGPIAESNPWRAMTLEWQVTSPPPIFNFDEIPQVVGGPYEYGVPGARHAILAGSPAPAEAAV